MEGEQLGNYRILRKLGEGGMGVVYVAEHTALGNPVAIKLLLPEMSANPELTQRFFNEAKAATRIQHPGIVRIFDFGRHTNGAAYFVMELLEGESLASRLAGRRRMRAAIAAAVVKQLAGALAAAHERGIVHRDLKPDNVFLVRDADVVGGERVKILDFGIAKLVEHGSPVKTRVGSLMGTPMYMSPEQCRGAGEVDPRSDIYSLGCIWFEMVCGRPPFESEGIGELLAAHQHVAPPSPRSLEPSVPSEDEARILRMLAKDPAQRPASMAELVAQLNGGAPPTLPPTIFAGEPADVAQPRTTLGGAAAAISAPRPASKRWWPLASAAAGAAVIAIIAMRFAHGGGTQEQETHAPAPEAAPTTPAQRALAPAAAPAPPQAATPSVAPAAPRPTVTIHLESEPAGAQVHRDGVTIGTTPLDMTAPPEASAVTFSITLAGYQTLTFAYPGDESLSKRAILERTPRASAPRPATKPAKPDVAKPVTAPIPTTPVPASDLYHSR